MNELVSCDLYLQGDLNQMSIQRQFLTSIGYRLEQCDVYPVVKKEDVIKALSVIWCSRTEGWWHYKDEFIKYGICTEKDYKGAFRS